DENAGHDRIAGEVSHEVRLVRGDVLDGDNALLALDLDHAINQEKRIAMRQNRLDFGDVQRPFLRCGSFRFESGEAVLIFCGHKPGVNRKVTKETSEGHQACSVTFCVDSVTSVFALFLSGEL